MISQQKTVFLSAVFFMLLFAISILPATSVGTSVNSNAQNSDRVEEKALSLAPGTTMGTFTGNDDDKKYILDVTPGIWNITLETGNVSLDDAYLRQLRTDYSSYFEQDFPSWEYYDSESLSNNDVDYFEFSDYFPEGIAITTPGKLMIELEPSGVSYDELSDPWHYQIHVSQQTPISFSNEINIEMEENIAKPYTFTVSTSGYYNFSYEANDTEYKTFIFADNGEPYATFKYSDGFQVLYFDAGMTYYAFVYTEEEFFSYFDGSPLQMNISLNQFIADETILDEGSASLSFTPTDELKTILWEGSPEGLYQISAECPSGMDIGFGLISLTSENGLVADFLGIGEDENMSLFIRSLETEDWSQPIGELGQSHYESYFIYSSSNFGIVDVDVEELWTTEHLSIVIFSNIGGSGTVNLTITEVSVETISFDTPTTTTINESFTETSFKTFQFQSKTGYEYNTTIAPDINSHDGGVSVSECFYVGTDRLHVIGDEPRNFTTYDEIPGGGIGSSEITVYLILTVETTGTNWGRLTVTVDDIEATELNLDDEVTKTFTENDQYQMYKVDVSKDKTYNFNLKLSENSNEFAYIALFNENSKVPDVETPIDLLLTLELFGTPFLGLVVVDDLVFENTLTLASNEDQTIYILSSAGIGSEVSLTVSEVDQGFAIGGFALYLLIAAIPLALLLGLFAQKKKEIV